MKWMELVSSVVGSLAWPVTVVTLAVVFRRPLTGLVARLTGFEGKGFKLSFREALSAVDVGVANATASMVGDQQREPASTAQTSPTRRVLEAWQGLEREIARICSSPRLGGSGDAEYLDGTALQRAREAQLLQDPDILEAVETLNQLRNEVKLGLRSPTSGDATAYAQTVSNVEAYLRLREDYIESHGP